MHTQPDLKGFTLIELLIVIGIIGFLAASVLFVADPVKRIQDARDARRSAEANSILNAILQKQVDDIAYYNGVSAAPVITQSGSNVQVIVRDSTGIVCNSATTRPGCNKPMDTAAANLNCVVDFDDVGVTGLAPKYISEIPLDPRGSGNASGCATGTSPACTTVGDLVLGATNTGYYIARTAGNRIEIGSCKPEQATSVSVKR